MKTSIAIAAVLLVALATPGRAQEQKPAASPPPASTLKLQLVLSRYQGDKKISSLPYTLTVINDERSRSGRASLRLGAQVPITTFARQTSEASSPMVPTVQYRDVGTSVDCLITALDDGRFKLELTLEDSSVDPGTGSGQNVPHPAFKSFRTSDQMLLRDGQTAQYSSATDKVNGDVYRVDVTLTVVK